MDSVRADGLRGRRRAEAARLATARQQAEEERLQALDALRLAFLNAASHELNTPLTPIRLQVQMLKEEPSLDGRARARLEVVERNVLRLARLVKDMLDASALQAGRLHLRRTRVDLAQAIVDTVAASRAEAEAAGVALHAVVRQRAVVHADPARVLQVLFNLVGNALRSSPGGRVEVGLRVRGGHATVYVADTGPGFAPHEARLVFEPFGRGHDAGAVGAGGAVTGSGLGLFLSKAIVAQHGGRIWAESAGPGQGARFCFSLRLADARRGEGRPLGPYDSRRDAGRGGRVADGAAEEAAGADGAEEGDADGAGEGARAADGSSVPTSAMR